MTRIHIVAVYVSAWIILLNGIFADANGEKLHFNPTVEVCGSSNSVSCINEKNESIKIAFMKQTSIEIISNEKDVVTTDVVSVECSSYDHTYAEHLAHESDCKLFYICKYGIKVLRKCPSGLHFNAMLQVCDLPNNTGCISHVTGIEEDKIDSSVQNNMCLSGSFVHISHEFNCGLYYTCDNGRKILLSCPPGLHFNAALQICDWSTNAGCLTSGSTGSTVDEDEDNTSKNNKCPLGNMNVLHIPHEVNCRLFYTCSNGFKILRQCPSILHFNAILQVCDWPENAGCSSSDEDDFEDNLVTTNTAITDENQNSSTESNQTSDTVEGENDDEHGNVTGTIISTQSTVPNVDEIDGSTSHTISDEVTKSTTRFDSSTINIPNKCPINSHNTVFVPHESDCHLYYICNNQELILQECPLGLHFNVQLNVCDWPELAGCSSSNENEVGSDEEVSTEENDTSTVENNECPLNNIIVVHLPHETNCSLFYKCVYGEKVPQHCPSGLHFNAQLNVCDWPELAGCLYSDDDEVESGEEASTEENDTSTVDNNECPLNGNGIVVHLPHEANCSLFYKCVYGEKVLQHCPSGLHFDAQLNVCNWPVLAGCSFSNEDDVESGEEALTEENDTSTVENNECPISDNGMVIHLPHEANCSLFYKCVYGEKVPQQCSHGLHFNAQLNVCDWPERAGCLSSYEDDVGSGEEASTEENDSIENGKCPSNVTHLPHESDCNLFYTCVYGNKLIQRCPIGLHFNDQLQNCDWPQNAGCEYDMEYSSTDITENSQSTTAPIFDSKLCIGNCPSEDPPMLILLPHEECTKFCKCSHGIAYVYRCPSRLHFNNELLVCDYQEHAGCEQIDTLSSTTDSTIVFSTDDQVTSSISEIGL